jgi:hypothetical protein
MSLARHADSLIFAGGPAPNLRCDRISALPRWIIAGLVVLLQGIAQRDAGLVLVSASDLRLA